MTTHDVWVCPICGQAPSDPAAIMAHGREKHPSVLPAHATIAQRLDLIAALADEAQLTAGHPNPDGQQARARRPPSGRAPAGTGSPCAPPGGSGAASSPPSTRWATATAPSGCGAPSSSSATCETTG